MRGFRILAASGLLLMTSAALRSQRISSGPGPWFPASSNRAATGSSRSGQIRRAPDLRRRRPLCGDDRAGRLAEIRRRQPHGRHADEYKAIVNGAIAHFGTMRSARPTRPSRSASRPARYPNWDGAEQKAAIRYQSPVRRAITVETDAIVREPASLRRSRGCRPSSRKRSDEVWRRKSTYAFRREDDRDFVLATTRRCDLGRACKRPS